MLENNGPIPTSIAPWLTLRDGEAAVEFYKAAFGAIETYRLDMPDGGLVCRLSVYGAEFWVSNGIPENEAVGKENLGGGTIRLILTVADPEGFFSRAINAGAVEIYPVGEAYGWKLGRVEDPFGLHWEIGHII